MAPALLADFEAVLDLENPDVFKWLTGQVGGRAGGGAGGRLPARIPAQADPVGLNAAFLRRRCPPHPRAPWPQAESPPELLANRAFVQLQQHVQSLRDQHHSVPPPPAGEAPREWVRGWGDSGTPQPSIFAAAEAPPAAEGPK